MSATPSQKAGLPRTPSATTITPLASEHQKNQALHFIIESGIHRAWDRTESREAAILGWAGHVGSRIGAAFVGAVFAAMGLMALLYAVQFLPHAAIVTNIRSSFIDGSLQEQDWLDKNDRLGYNQYNDCLLIQMALFRRKPWADTVAPYVKFNDWPVVIESGKGERISECAIAKSAAFSDAPLDLYPLQSYFAYSRYFHAFRLPAYLLLETLNVGAIRQLYRITVFGLLAMILAAQMLITVLPSERADSLVPKTDRFLRRSFFIMLSLIFMRFYGLSEFAPSLTHAPSDIIIFAMIAGLSIVDILVISDRTLYVVCGIFGVLVFAFDFLHGALPLALAALIGCVAMTADQKFGSRQTIISILLSAASFIVGAGTAALVKILSIALALGPEEVIRFFSQLNYRMSGGGGTLSEVLKRLSESLTVIFFADQSYSKAFLFATGLLLIIAYGIALCRARGTRIVQAHALLLSVLVIGVWYLVFRSHTTVADHAHFMVRLLVWPLTATAGMVIIAISVLAGSANRLQHSIHQRGEKC